MRTLTHLRAAHAEIAQAEGNVRVFRIKLGQEPRRCGVRREEFDHRLVIDAA
jgi:hypothetical protein